MKSGTVGCRKWVSTIACSGPIFPDLAVRQPLRILNLRSRASRNLWRILWMRLGVQSAHLVGAKTGGGIAMQFAATYPQRTRSVVVASGPFVALGPKVEQNSQQVRLGSAATPAEIAYFDKMRDDMRPETKKKMEVLLGQH